MESPFLIPRATDLRISFNGKCDFALENLLRSRYNLGYVIDDYYILRGNSLLFFIQLFLYVYQDIYTRYFFLKCCQRARRIVRGGIRCKRRVKKRGYLTKLTSYLSKAPFQQLRFSIRKTGWYSCIETAPVWVNAKKWSPKRCTFKVQLREKRGRRDIILLITVQLFTPDTFSRHQANKRYDSRDPPRGVRIFTMETARAAAVEY